MKKWRQVSSLVFCLRLLLISLEASSGSVAAFSTNVKLSAKRWAIKKENVFALHSSSQYTDADTTESVLEEHGFGRRLEVLYAEDLPVVAELQYNKKCELCQIVGFASSKPGTPPRIQLADDRLVALDQVTCIWDMQELPENLEQAVQDEINTFPAQHIENKLELLYKHYSHRVRKKNTLTKKKLAEISERHPESAQILRRSLKAGPGMDRLVDASVVMDYLYYENDPKGEDDNTKRRTVAAHLVSQDADLGGRFKRFGCIYVDYSEASNTLTFLNGGWLVLDPSVRTGHEARKFTKRNEGKFLTTSDIGMASRLEAFAMGGTPFEEEIDLGIREILKELDLPTTPKGAQEALLQTGQWTAAPSQDSETKSRFGFEPWSQETLDAAKTYAARINEERESGGNKGGRVDLTALPCVCVDAKGTSFRDDAIGIRSREKTGRKLLPDGSKWEILVHIVDVSDIYVEDGDHGDRDQLEILRNTAISRGLSRYDLPAGPLHLLPPRLLKALSMVTTKADSGKFEKTPNKCVTLWLNFDERSGKVLDFGLERTLISSPVSLTYNDATNLLENKEMHRNGKDFAAKITAILAIAERSLVRWSKKHQRGNAAASQREERLAVKQMVADQTISSSKRDDGRDGFRRTRGHKLVDSSLDLYSFSLSQLLMTAKAPIPRASGSGAARSGRLGTAPLRRFIDGMAQRQALAALCNYGGPPLTANECRDANKAMNQAMDRISKFRSGQPRLSEEQRERLRLLQIEVNKDYQRKFPALATGRENEVVIQGIGVVAKCTGVEGSLKSGKKVNVVVRKVDVAKGIALVKLLKTR